MQWFSIDLLIQSNALIECAAERYQVRLPLKTLWFVNRVTLEVGSLVCNCGLVYTRHAHHSGLLQPNAMERTLFLFEHSEVVFSSGQTETETFGRNHEDTCLPFDWVLYVLIRHIANTLCFSLRGQTIALNVGC